jgi:hypothetical protein
MTATSTAMATACSWPDLYEILPVYLPPVRNRMAGIIYGAPEGSRRGGIDQVAVFGEQRQLVIAAQGTLAAFMNELDCCH